MTQNRYDYDYFVIGGGSGGVRSARIAAQHGAKVGIAEGAAWGGTCVNLGCVPKKLMSYASDFGHGFEDSKGYGWETGERTFSWETLIDNKNKEINRLNSIYQKILKSANVDIHEGFVKFIDPHTLQIGDDKTVTADKILIAVGGTPRQMMCDGYENAIVSDDIFHLPHHPKKTVIYGGGYVAVEFAHILHGLGCEIDIIYYSDMILRGFDNDLRLGLVDELRKQGINLHFKSMIDKITTNDTTKTVHLDNGKTIECDTVFAAIGRVPNIQNLGLDKANIETNEKDEIVVTDSYQTNIDNVYALGDVTDTPKLTPIAILEGHVLADRLFGNEKLKDRTVDYDALPTAVFSQPPMGTVGLTEEQAREKMGDVKIYRTSFTPMIHQLSGRAEKTIMKIIVDRDTDKVLGLHILGRDAPEMLQGFAAAIKAGATKADIDSTIAIHPTSAEELVTMYSEALPAE